MTNTTTDPTTTGLRSDDPRLAFGSVVALAGNTIAGVRPDQYGLLTPCSEWNVRELIAHEIAVLWRVAGVARAEDPNSFPELVTGIPDARLHDAWTTAAHDVQAAWTDPEILDRDLVLPFATMPGAMVMGIYVAEIQVHTWDLARATSQRPAWDEDLAAATLGILEQMLPAEPRDETTPFGPVCPTEVDAPAIDRLAAWLGRQP